MGEEQGLSAELKPCPFCGSRGIGLSWNGQPAREMFLRCTACGACGPATTDASVAIVTGWNTRSEGLQPPVGEVEEEVFSSLGASKAPSSASAGVAETPSGGWPATGPDFNRWNADAARFVRLVQDNPGFWLADFQVKYLQLNIDTRDGGFTLKNRDGARIEPGRVVLAINKHREMFGRDVSPTDCQTSGGEA